MTAMDDRALEEWLELSFFAGALPWERWLINRQRRREGLPPLRYREVVGRLRTFRAA